MFLSYLIPALLLGTAFSPDYAQQSSKYLVTEIDDNDSYNLTIRLDNDRRAEMLACMGELTDQDLSAPDAQTVFAETDGVNLTYLSSRSMIVLSTVYRSQENAEHAQLIGEELKQCLDLRPEARTSVPSKKD